MVEAPEKTLGQIAYEADPNGTPPSTPFHALHPELQKQYEIQAAAVAERCAQVADAYGEEQAILEAQTEDSGQAFRIFNRAQAGNELARRIRAFADGGAK